MKCGRSGRIGRTDHVSLKISTFLAGIYTILECGLSKCMAVHSFLPCVPSRAFCIHDVSSFSLLVYITEDMCCVAHGAGAMGYLLKNRKMSLLMVMFTQLCSYPFTTVSLVYILCIYTFFLNIDIYIYCRFIEGDIVNISLNKNLRTYIYSIVYCL